jgi:truncated hemoglobin YjbI
MSSTESSPTLSPTHPLLAIIASHFLHLNRTTPELAGLFSPNEHTMTHVRFLTNHTAFVRHCLGGTDLNMRRMRSAHKRLFQMRTREFMALVRNLRTAIQMTGGDEELMERVELMALACEAFMVDANQPRDDVDELAGVPPLSESAATSADESAPAEGVVGLVRKSSLRLWRSISSKRGVRSAASSMANTPRVSGEGLLEEEQLL